MIALTGADLVLPDRIVPSGTLVIDNGCIAAISAGVDARLSSAIALPGHTIVPGFVDVHVHGVDGTDALDPGDAIAYIAGRMPRYGVTAFCPTTVACAPDDLRRVLIQVGLCRAVAREGSARVLPAHLESNFINPDYCGAQPRSCLRSYTPAQGHSVFCADDVLRVIEEHQQDVAIVTMAPEMAGGLALIQWLLARGVRVSLGHSGATYQEAIAAIDAGATHATHLFNRMPPLHHREPGLVGAVLERDDVVAEIICDGAHVHPSLVRMAIAVKGSGGVLAITDATAAAGCPVGTRASLGGQDIVAGPRTAQLPDGTIAGSVTTMDGAFRWLLGDMELSLVQAVRLCSANPARAVGLANTGSLTDGAVADLVVLDPELRVARTYVAGRLAYERGRETSNTRPGPSV